MQKHTFRSRLEEENWKYKFSTSSFSPHMDPFSLHFAWSVPSLDHLLLDLLFYQNHKQIFSYIFILNYILSCNSIFPFQRTCMQHPFYLVILCCQTLCFFDDLYLNSILQGILWIEVAHATFNDVAVMVMVAVKVIPPYSENNSTKDKVLVHINVNVIPLKKK